MQQEFKKNTCNILYHGKLSKKIVYMCHNFSGPPEIEQCKLASKPDVLFTVFSTYFLLVVYSLYRELKGTAPTNHA